MTENNHRPSPYPPDTRSKGWRFEVDMETVKASDTWLIAKTGAVRGALLLLWSEAWQQSPCGTLPNDDQLIALLIDMAPAAFAKNRAVLMRGWWLADDGRLYHDTITSRVLAMLDKRANDAQRAAARRARKADSASATAGVTQESRVTHAGVGDESDTKHQAPSTKHQKEKTGESAPARLALECPPDVSAQTWADWLSLRRSKKAPVTATVLDGARSEASKAGLDLDAFLRVWCTRGSQGLQAEWLKPAERGHAASEPPEPAWRREQRERNEAFLGPAATKRSTTATTTATAEVIDVTSRLLG